MMPTKRRILIFLIVLAVMMTAKYVWGQDANEQVGWDPANVCYSEPSIGQCAIAAIIWGPIFGAVCGLGTAWNRHLAAQRGDFFRADLVELGL
jgi:hypothetical protein